MEKVIIKGLADLERFARRIADSVSGGTVIGLIGDLGAGKTQFVKFFVKALGGDEDEVVSPTFTLLNEYSSSRCKIYHFDLYRLSSIEELEEIGYKDFFFDENAITIVEWIDRVYECAPEGSLILRFRFRENEDEREVEVFSK